MKFFFDTSVLIAAVLVRHVHHQRSAAVYLKADKKTAACAAHSLAEVYASLTRMPGAHRMEGDQVLLFLEDIRRRFTVITLDEEDYYSAIASAATAGVSGGTIYDALLGRCALKANAATIYTWDLNHFKLLGPEVARRVQSP
jgi:predicted nucleic acid-binding protein